MHRFLCTAAIMGVVAGACSDPQEPPSVWDDLSGTIYFLGGTRQDSIAKVDPRTGIIAEVPGAPTAGFLAVSPDGTWLLITARHVLRYSLVTGEVTVLAPNVEEFNSSFGAVSPDGQRVVNTQNDRNGYSVIVRAADGSASHTVLGPRTGHPPLTPQWVDNESIVFVSVAGDTDRLWTVRADGSGLGFFASDTGLVVGAIATAPQAQRLLVTQRPTPVVPEFWEVDYAGRFVRRIAVVGGGLYPWLAWSPDARYIAFCQATATSDADLFLVHVQSGQIKQLTFEPGYECSPAWAP